MPLQMPIRCKCLQTSINMAFKLEFKTKRVCNDNLRTKNAMNSLPFSIFDDRFDVVANAKQT